jgi:hypothetical protein
MKTSSTHIPSLLGLLLFTFVGILALLVATVVGAATLFTTMTGGQMEVRQLTLITVAIFEALLLLGAGYVSLLKVMQKPSADSDSIFTIKAWQIALLLAVAALAIWLGSLILDNEPVNWLLLPLLTLPAVFLPILVIFSLGSRGISLGPRWRTWNILGISMTLVPFVTFILEVMAVVFVFILLILYISSQPALIAQVERLSTQIYTLETDPEALIGMVAPLLFRPGIMAIVLLFFSVLIPMIEELVKPLGVWLFGNHISTPSQGFALGALCGAAFALLETFSVSVQSDDWSGLLLTRLGTDILHITTAALMGAAIVYAIRERRYLLLLGTYLLCVFLHGLWNGLAVLFAFSGVAESYVKQNLLSGLAIPFAVALGILAGLLLALLILSNRRRRKAFQSNPSLEETVP